MMGFTDNCAFTIGSHMTKTLISEQVSCELSHACRTKIANIDHEHYYISSMNSYQILNSFGVDHLAINVSTAFRQLREWGNSKLQSRTAE